jgi:hypothetical protein
VPGPRSIVRRLLDAAAPGGFLAVRDGTGTGTAYAAAIRRYNGSGAVPHHLRGPEQTAGHLDGLVSCPLWCPETTDTGTAIEPAVPGAVGRRPWPLSRCPGRQARPRRRAG